jgi:hypothetical protein
MHRFGFVLFALLLGAGFSTSAVAQAVLQSVTVRVESGQMDAYLDRVAKLQGVMDRVGGGARVSVWQASFAGTNSGNTMVSVAFPSLTGYAETTTKTSQDAEWQKVMSGLDDIRTIVTSSLLTSTDNQGAPPATATGNILQGVIVRPKAGKTAAYAAQIEKLKAVNARIGSSGDLRAWNVTFGGEGSGNVAVGIIYPSLAAFAEDQGKLQADPEGAKLFAALDDLRTVVSISLFTAE